VAALRRRTAAPTDAKPAISIAQVAGSGTSVTVGTRAEKPTLRTSISALHSVVHGWPGLALSENSGSLEVRIEKVVGL
jgi:hypothetical protein